MSLQYLSGIVAPRKKQAAAPKAAAPKKLFGPPPRKAAAATPKARTLQKVVSKTPTAKLIKAVQKQSPVTAQKIQKQRVQAQQRRAFKKSNEAAIIKQNDLEAQEAYKLPPLKVEVDNEELEFEAPDMSEDESSDNSFDESFEDMGIIYPEFSGARKVKKAKKASTKNAKRTAKTGGKQQRKTLKATSKANKGSAKNVKKKARAADTAARGQRRGELLKQGLDTASVILKNKFGVEGGGGEAAAPTAPTPETKAGFLDSIPMPVKILGGGALAFLAIKALK